MISFRCSHCGKDLKVKDELAGKKGKCPSCGQAVAVPLAVASTLGKSGSVNLEDEKTRLPEAPEEATLDPKNLDRSVQDRLANSEEHTGIDREGNGESTNALGEDGHNAELTDFLAPPQAEDELGRLGGFRILKILGHGGMGVVFQGEDPKLGRKVAIKAMLPHLAGSKSSQARFLREAKAAAALEHDHIVPILQVGEDRGAPFIVMPFLQGESLDDRMKRDASLPLAEILRIARETAEGLDVAHQRGLIHRDIKPANLWLEGGKSRVKILDFGLARAASGETGLTQSGAILGTPQYMAPEQAAGKKDIDHRCDLFSLGCVLYRLTTHEYPFKGDNTLAIISSLAMEQPTPPHEVRRQVPQAISDLVMELLAKKPEDRPESAQLVAHRLAKLAKELSEGHDDGTPGKAAATVVRPRPARETPTQLLKGTETKAGSAAPATAGRGKNPKLLIAGGVGLLLAAAILFFLFRSKDEPGAKEVKAKEVDPGKKEKAGSGLGPHDNLDPANIPAENRRPWQPKELVALLGDHQRRIHDFKSFTMSRDGKSLVCMGTVDIQFYDTATMRLRWDAADFPDSHMNFVAVFLPDGKHFLRREKLWDISGAAPTVVAAVNPPEVSRAAGAWTKPLVACSYEDGFVRIFEFAAGKMRRRQEFKAADPDELRPSDQGTKALQVAFTDAEGKTLLTIPASEAKTFKIWDLVASPPKVVHTANASQVVVSPDGKTIAVLDSNTITLLNVEQLPPRQIPNWKVKLDNPPHAMAFAPDGKRLIIARGHNQVDIWSVAPDQEKPLSTASGVDGTPALSSDNKVLYLFENAVTRDLRIFDEDAGSWKQRPVPHIGMGRPIYSPDGRQLLTQPFHGYHTTTLWDLSGVAPVEKALPPSVQSGYLLGWRDQELILVRDNRVWSWKGAGDPELLIEPGPGLVRTACVSRNGDALAFVRESKPGQIVLEIWDLRAKTPRQVAALDQKTESQRLQLSADGKRLAYGGHTTPSRLFVLDGAAWKEAWEGPETYTDGMSISADGDRLVTINNEMSLWDAKSLPPKAYHKFRINGWGDAEFSPDGRLLVVTSSDPKLAIYDAKTGALKKAWPLPQPIEYVNFAPDGRHLAITNVDRSIWILRLDPRTLE